jgi:hypothetical protein
VYMDATDRLWTLSEKWSYRRNDRFAFLDRLSTRRNKRI